MVTDSFHRRVHARTGLALVLFCSLALLVGCSGSTASSPASAYLIGTDGTLTANGASVAKGSGPASIAAGP